jgi:hypothetical protein
MENIAFLGHKAATVRRLARESGNALEVEVLLALATEYEATINAAEELNAAPQTPPIPGATS